MKKAFLFVLAVAVLASFFASSNPDGLERTVKDLGVLGAAAERAPLIPDYVGPPVYEGGIATVSEGIAGVLITLSVFWLAAFMLKGKS